MTNTFRITIVDETPYRTMGQYPSIYEHQEIYSNYVDVEEILIASGVSAGPRVPFCMHVDGAIESIDGFIENIHAEDGKVVGDLIFRKATQHLASVIDQIVFSPVYVHRDYDIEDRDGELPLLISKTWDLLEVRGRMA